MRASRQTHHIDFDRRRLKDIVAQADSHYGVGEGLRVLLAGGEATDRLRVAVQLAKRHGASLERIDLAAVAADGMALAEKSLTAILARDREADTVLFFDEADALFGRRTGVADSHDRYARTRTSFLAGLAAHSGIVLVAMAEAPGRYPDLQAVAEVEIRFGPPWPPREASTEIEPGFMRPLSNLHFLVVIGDLEIGFCQIDGFGSEHDVTDEQAGGKPGVLTYPHLVLRRAVSRSRDLYLWRQKIIDKKKDHRQVDLYQLETPDTKPVNHWRFIDCWPRRWSGPGFDALGGGVAFEEIELCYKRFEWL